MTTRTDGAMSTGAYEKYRNMLLDEEDDEGEYVPRCCCCDSMSYVRFFGIYSTMLSLLALRMRMAKAVEGSFLITDFFNLFIDHFKAQSAVVGLSTLSMLFAGIAFKTKLGKLLYGPIVMHLVVICMMMYNTFMQIGFRSAGNPLAKKLFTAMLDDLVVDHPDRTYVELYTYIMQKIGGEVALVGVATLLNIPLHLGLIVVCWRLRTHLEQQRYLQKAREERTAKKSEEKPKGSG